MAWKKTDSRRIAKEEVKEEVKKKELVVVHELPTQPVRSFTNEKGIEIELITIEEALTEIMKKLREGE